MMTKMQYSKLPSEVDDVGDIGVVGDSSNDENDDDNVDIKLENKMRKSKEPNQSENQDKPPLTLLIFLILTGIMLFLVWFRVDYHERNKVTRPKEFLNRQNRKYLKLSSRPTISSPIQVFTPEELFKWDGVNGKKILIAVNHLVFDVSQSKKIYGPGGSYHSFAGIDASPFLIQNSIPKKLKEAPTKIFDLQHLKGDDLISITNWYNFFINKYPIVGTLKGEAQKKIDDVIDCEENHVGGGGARGGAILKDYDLESLRKEFTKK